MISDILMWLADLFAFILSILGLLCTLGLIAPMFMGPFPIAQIFGILLFWLAFYLWKNPIGYLWDCLRGY